MAEVASVSHVLKEPSQADLDAALEREIETARLAATAAADIDPDLAREYFATMATLISQRSPQQIACMEARLPAPWRS